MFSARPKPFPTTRTSTIGRPREQSQLLAYASRLGERGTPEGEDGVQGDVAAGIGEIVTTTGVGSETTSLMRFQRETNVVAGRGHCGVR